MFWRDVLVLLSYIEKQIASVSDPAASHTYLGRDNRAILNPSSPLISSREE